MLIAVLEKNIVSFGIGSRKLMWQVRSLSNTVCLCGCSVLFFSRPRSDSWPHHGRTFSIFYLCPLSLTDSSTGSPVHVLMLSIQAVRGLPRLRASGLCGWIVGLPPFHFPNPGRGSGAEPPADGRPGVSPRKTSGILYVIWCILVQSGGSYL